jgi:hypothetical protein
MKLSSKFVSVTAILLASAPFALQAATLQATDDAKAQSCLNAFVDQYLPGRKTVAKLDSDDSTRSLTAANHFEMAMVASTRDGRVIATARCKIEQGVTQIAPSSNFLIAAN